MAFSAGEPMQSSAKMIGVFSSFRRWGTRWLREYFSVGPSFGRPRWLIRIAFPPSARIFLIVGMAARIRVSSVMLYLSSSGTLKSTLTRALSLAKEWSVNWLILFGDQFGEVVEATDQLADIAHFVVIPAHCLDELGVAVGDHAGLGSVVKGAVSDADDIGADNFVFRIAKAFISGGFHCGVNLFERDLFVEYGNELGKGAGNDGDALCAAVELTFQFGEHEADGLCGAGAIGHDVGGCGAGAAEVTFGVGGILGVLVIGIRVDGRHQARDNTEFIIEDLGHRR